MGKKSKRSAPARHVSRPGANERARDSDSRRRDQKLRLEERRLDNLVKRLREKAERFRKETKEADERPKKRRRGLYGAAKPADDITLEEPVKEAQVNAPPTVNLLERYCGRLWTEPNEVGRELLRAHFARAQLAHEARGQLAQAERRYRQYLTLDPPDHCGASGFLLLVLLEQGQLEDAEDLLQMYGPRASVETEETEHEDKDTNASQKIASVEEVDGDAAPNLERRESCRGGLGIASRTILAYGQYLVSFITTFITKDAASPETVGGDAQLAIEANPYFAHSLLNARVFLDVLEDADAAYALAPGPGSALEATYLMSTELLPLLLDTDGAVSYLSKVHAELVDNDEPHFARYSNSIPSVDVLVGTRPSHLPPMSSEDELVSSSARFLRQWNRAQDEIGRWKAGGLSTSFAHDGASEEDDSGEGG